MVVHMTNKTKPKLTLIKGGKCTKPEVSEDEIELMTDLFKGLSILLRLKARGEPDPYSLESLTNFI